jgi:hypothetical protein
VVTAVRWQENRPVLEAVPRYHRRQVEVARADPGEFDVDGVAGTCKGHGTPGTFESALRGLIEIFSYLTPSEYRERLAA